MTASTWEPFLPRLQDRVAVVTGSSSGHGRAIALRLAREGAALVCVDLQASALPGGFEVDSEISTDEFIRQHGGRAIYVHADVTSTKALEVVGDRALEEFGRLDIWVNNAGISYGTVGIVEETEEQYSRTMDVNLRGTWNGAREAVRRMRAQEPSGRLRGRIVNIGSIAGSVGQTDLTVYSASKGAVHNLTKALAIEVAPDLISVNTVAPGYLPTAMNRGIWDDHEALMQVQAMHPLPLGTADDVAAAVAFLVSDEAAFVTAATLPVDGGMAAK